MITAIDTSVLLDIISNDARFGRSSVAALQAARNSGRIVACPVVWAEVRAFFDQAQPMREAFARAGIYFDHFAPETAELAGSLWRRYRRAGGTRTRPLPDFFIGAHAQQQADALLTRDRGFSRRYFKELKVLYPTS